ncbi:MAG: EAL domain-containing protein, partial [Lachnospiraceae bacterium]|nr:EAL domain-containing protein [Lachnospiraceae bacterium]
RQRRAVITWMGMWIAAALIQFMNSQLLVVGFACALGISVIFFQFENPELHLDRNTGLFNYIAYTRYTEQLYSSGKGFFTIAVLLEDAFHRDVRLKNSQELASKAADIFLKVPGASTFKIMEDEMILIFRDRAEAQNAWNFFQRELPGQIEKYESLQCLPSLYFINNVGCVNSGGELLELVHYVRNQKRDAMSGNFQFVEDIVAEQMVSEKAMTQEIREALAEDRVQVYYQPIFSIEEQRFTSAEAIVRIIDRDGKLIPPAKFIHIAESNGMIIDIGKRVFEKVCAFFVNSNLEKLGIQYIEVNLSVVQCADESLADDYMEIMKRFQLDPGRINLEITESASMRAKKILVENMQKMMDYGIRFSLDDFGTGQSSR